MKADTVGAARELELPRDRKHAWSRLLSRRRQRNLNAGDAMKKCPCAVKVAAVSCPWTRRQSRR